MESGRQLELVFGDLTEEKVDAIVNAANRQLMHGGGVAAAIIQKGGRTIQEESDAWVRTNGPIDPDHPAWTHAGMLPCRWIIHAAGPVWGEGQEDQKLIQTIRGVLRLAGQLHASSLALPPLSTGIFGFPKERAAPLFIKTITGYWQTDPLSTVEQVRITIIDNLTTQIFQKSFEENGDDGEIH